MNKLELIEKVSQNTQLSNDAVRKVYDTMFLIIKQELMENNKVILTGFGTFKLSSRAARKGIKPKTGKIIEVSPRNVITFKQSPSLKEFINRRK